MRNVDRFFVFFLLLGIGPASAFPDGAPWGSADPKSAENCHSCHYDGEAVMDSESIAIDGLPLKWESGGRFLLTLLLKESAGENAGYLVSASEGSFSPDGQTGTNISEVRSIVPARLSNGKMHWQIFWTAPVGEVRPTKFNMAVNASNGDGSPFGDSIHFKTTTMFPAAE